MSERLLILTQYFPPEMGAPQNRLFELGEALFDRGWEVEVLTALPNYPKARILDGYPWISTVVEKVGRLRTVRVPLVPSHRGIAGRMVCYLSFAATAAYGGKRCAPPSIIYVESPPLFIGLPALFLARRWGCPFVLNVSDLWPESAVRMGLVRRGIATAVAERFELFLYRKAAAVSGQSDGIIDSIRKRAPRTRVAILTNAVDTDRFHPTRGTDAARKVLGSAPGPVFVYAGLLGLAQGLDQLLDLAKMIPADAPGRLVLIGDGPVRAHLARRISLEAIDRVTLADAVPRERVPEILAAADGALISLGRSIPGAVPSKIYEAMATARPILLVAEGEPARRVVSAGAGLAVRPGDISGLLAAFLELAMDPRLRQCLGEAGRKAAETLYNRENVANRLDELLREVLE